MTKIQLFVRKFLKHADEFQQVSGAYNFEIDDTDYTLDIADSGRILLWRDYSTLVAWTQDQDYQALAVMAWQDELKEYA